MIRRAILAGLAICSSVFAQGQVGPNVPPFHVRDGYRVTLVADNLGEARFIEFGDNGTLYLSQPRAGTILALRDTDNDGSFDARTEFVTGKRSVHCMHFKDGYLWFTQSADGTVHKARDTDNDGKADEVVQVIGQGVIPSGGGHPYRGILVSDDSIYITVSDPSNMTEELNSDRKTIYRFDLDGSNKRVFATGIRNTEKIRFRPGTQEIWGCDHGSDWFGRPYGDSERNQPITDLNPPEELNHYVEGGFYGHPYLTGNRVPRPEFAGRKDLHELAAKTTPPAWCFPAHWAPNGHTFLSTDHFPGHKGDLFVAFHGSWNASRRSGYCIERVLFDEMTGKPYGTLTVVSTLSGEGRVLARPVDCAEAPDGSVLFSCDQTRRIFRISKAE
jgi:glucose/arabinose dehydrogenase